MSTRGSRAGSAPWSRLKPVIQDPLETMGLPSKGETRLLDFKTQERYYTKIVERYMAFCSDAGRGDELLRRLAKLDITKETPQTNNALPLQRSNTTTPSSNTSSSSRPNTSTQNGLPIIIMSMRKLREGILASNRIDTFSIQAYIFCIRLSILVKQWESYQPALLHLLKRMHTTLPLSTTELQEFAGYLVLDLACRQHDLTAAYTARQQYGLKDAKIDSVLRALTHDNYHLFWRVKGSVDGHKAKVMEFAEEGVKRQALKCLGRTYLQIDLPSLEGYTNSNWGSLVREFAVGWQLEGTKVVIRKPKTK